MLLPDEFKAEAIYRGRIAETAPTFTWTVAVVEVKHVSDADRFLGELRDYVKTNNRCVPSDKIVRGEQSGELYLLLRGNEEDCFLKLTNFFGGPGIGVEPRLKGLNLTARVGLCQYSKGKSPLELIQRAYESPTIYNISTAQKSSAPLLSKEG